MPDDIAIKVDHISKTFKLPHEKNTSIKSAVVNFWRRDKGYEIQKALQDISFDIKKGEFFGVVGRNGSGKSTLLKLLAGIYAADSGDIRIDGRLTPFIELGVGFSPELTGRENVFLNGSLLGFNRKEMEAMYNDIVEFAELERFMDQKLKNYSSGMLVRLAFSIAIRANTEILVLDEVLAVGDANFQNKCLEQFRNFKEQHKTVILVSHDTNMIQKFCDRALLIRSGKVDAIGTALEISYKYTAQNMADEIKREQKMASNGLEPHEKKVNITRVKISDKNDNKKSTFNKKDSLKVTINYKVNNVSGPINFTVGLRTVEGNLIFGYTTQSSNYAVDKNRGKISLVINELHLLQGYYHLNVTCYGNDQGRQYDFLPKSNTVMVMPEEDDKDNVGILGTDHEWK